MGPLSSAQPSPSLNLTQSRMDSTNPQFRENAAVRDRLDITKPSGTSAARSQKTETRDYQNTEKLASADTRSEDTRSTSGGNKRGGVLDISV